MPSRLLCVSHAVACRQAPKSGRPSPHHRLVWHPSPLIACWSIAKGRSAS